MTDRKRTIPEEQARAAYFAGQMSMDEYMRVLKESEWGDQTRREVERSVRRILNKLKKLKAAQ